MLTMLPIVTNNICKKTQTSYFMSEIQILFGFRSKMHTGVTTSEREECVSEPHKSSKDIIFLY